MNILISRKDLKNTKSGVPKNVLRQSEQFCKHGYNVYVISETINIPLIEKTGAKAVKTFRWPISGHTRRKIYNCQVERYIQKNNISLVIGHGDILQQDILCMHNCTHLAHEKIYGAALPENDEVGRMHKKILLKGSYKILLCNSNIMKNDFIQRFGLDEDIIEVIYPETSFEAFKLTQAAEYRYNYRQKYNIKDEDSIIGLITSGNFRKRNVDGMIKAFSMIKQNGVKLFIAGADSAAPYKKLASELGIGDKVIFAPAIEDVQAYYHMIDIFVLPAHIEEFGRSVVEAMYCKKPVVVSQYTGASEIVDQDNFIIKDNLPQELAAVLKQILFKKEANIILGEKNHKIAQKYSAENMMAAFWNTMKEKRFLV